MSTQAIKLNTVVMILTIFALISGFGAGWVAWGKQQAQTTENTFQIREITSELRELKKTGTDLARNHVAEDDQRFKDLKEEVTKIQINIASITDLKVQLMQLSTKLDQFRRDLELRLKP